MAEDEALDTNRMAERVDADRPLSDEELRLIDAYWRAANYLSVGQLCLLDNPRLRDIKDDLRIATNILNRELANNLFIKAIGSNYGCPFCNSRIQGILQVYCF